MRLDAEKHEGVIRCALDPPGRPRGRGGLDDDAEQRHDQRKTDAFEDGARGNEECGDDAAATGMADDFAQQGERLPRAGGDAILRCAHAPVHDRIVALSGL
ncbi:MAG TPA: hypothetical protein VF113_01095 [Stellaceae bacterium]